MLELLLIVIVFWLIVAIRIGEFGEKRGLEFMPIFILSLVVSPPIAYVVTLLMISNRKQIKN